MRNHCLRFFVIATKIQQQNEYLQQCSAKDYRRFCYEHNLCRTIQLQEGICMYKANKNKKPKQTEHKYKHMLYFNP